MNWNRRTTSALAALCIACLLPFASFAAINEVYGINYGRLCIYAATVVLILLMILGVFRRLISRSSTARLANTLSAAVFFFFLFDVVRAAVYSGTGLSHSTVPLILWLLMTSAAVSGAWRWGDRQEAGLAILVAAVVMFAFPAVRIISFQVELATNRDRKIDTVFAHPHFRQRPDIYYFILDGYARADKIKNLLGYDNSPFLKFLEERKFYVVDQATANYPTTWLSIASTVSMKYVQTDEMPPFLSAAPFFEIVKGNNPVVRTLRENGYKYAYVANGYPAFNCSGAEDICIGRNDVSDSPILGEMEINLLELTPIYPILMKVAPEFAVKPFRGSLAQIADVADAITSVRADAPLYVFSHLIVPHPPYLRNALCGDNGKLDASLQGWSKSSITAYTAYMQCANRQMSDLVDRILKRDRNAVFIIQGDHGTAFYVNWTLPLKDWSRFGNAERLAPLSAVRLPEPCRHTLYPTMSLVNTFRAVFACLEGERPEFLPDVSYIATDANTNEFGHVLRVDPNLK